MPPAARMTDLHVCITHPIIPLPIAKASTSTFIGFLPAARVSDECACASNGRIVTGSPNVFIDSKPAARIGDKVAPPGIVVTGCQTVFIGETPQVSALIAAAALGLPFCQECSPGALSEPSEGTPAAGAP